MSPGGLRFLVAASICMIAVVGAVAVYSAKIAAWIVGSWTGLGAVLWIVSELWLWRGRARQRRALVAPLPRAQAVRL